LPVSRAGLYPGKSRRITKGHLSSCCGKLNQIAAPLVETPSNWKNQPELVNHTGGGKATEAGSNVKSGLMLLVSPVALANCRKRRRGSVCLELAEMPGGYEPFWIGKLRLSVLPRKCLIPCHRRLVKCVLEEPLQILTGMKI
jgi:hypothetical protein